MKINKNKLFWDYDIRNIDEISDKNLRRNLFVKILTSYNWYDILNSFTKREIEEMLNQEVINRIFPKELRKRYEFLSRFLSKHPLSITR